MLCSRQTLFYRAKIAVQFKFSQMELEVMLLLKRVRNLNAGRIYGYNLKRLMNYNFEMQLQLQKFIQ